VTANDLDLDGMECLNVKFHAETREQRDGDMIRRIPCAVAAGSAWCCCSSSRRFPAHWMALRALGQDGGRRALLPLLQIARLRLRLSGTLERAGRWPARQARRAGRVSFIEPVWRGMNAR
jgi:hypothetical protein